MMYIWHVFYNVITVFLNFKIFEVQKIRSVIGGGGGGGGGDRKKNLNYEKGSYSWKSEIEPPKKLFFRGN